MPNHQAVRPYMNKQVQGGLGIIAPPDTIACQGCLA